MGMKTNLVLGVAAVAVIAGGAYWLTQHKEMGGHAEAMLSTPPGITFQKVKVGRVVYVPGASSDAPALVTVYADSSGHTLYTFDKDTPGKSACAGDCAKAWPPVAAEATATPTGNWTIITRDDGSKQWALRGKPLYTFTKDKKVGDNNGQNADEVWHMAALQASEGMKIPYGISVQEVAEAAGQALVDPQGMALYAYKGDVKSGKLDCGNGPCSSVWHALEAGQLANPTGDFTIVNRDDGIQQWAYRGRPLFTYGKDVEIGDANGKGVDRKFDVAVVERYYMPPGVSIISNEKKGGLLTDANGMTLYARDRVSFNGTGGHSARGGDRGNPDTGLLIGLSGCDANCTQTWVPLKAPPDAKPSGYWMLMKRDDGSQQWAYQGYAVYTYSGDRKPGDTIGQDTYTLLVNDGEKVADARHGLGLYWRTTSP
jgi:predicted lipoprotein with Yx(FWY)xxD motif